VSQKLKLVMTLGSIVVSAACSEHVGEPVDDVTVITMELDEKLGQWIYDPDALVGYTGGPIAIRAVHGDETVFEYEATDLANAANGLMSSIDQQRAGMEIPSKEAIR